jgi:protein O-GlcNAc transferase
MRHTDLSRNFAIANSWSRDIARRVSSLKMPFSFDDKRSRKTKITVGYLSNNFCNHTVAYLMLSMFGLHNRDEFEVFCYSYGEDDGSYHRKRIERDCDKFVDLHNLNHADAAKCIYEDQVDILVDLKGHTGGNRLGICALRPAPVQVRYLGLAGTTGADFFDYIITDRIVTPEDHAQHYSEKFVYMPHCYQVNDHTRAISDKDWKRADFGLPEGGFVFCSFNQGYKIEPVMFDSWMKILRQVPEGVLWLQRTNKTAEKNLGLEAEARGVKPERLIFSQKLPPNEHLARLRLADLALDTRIVNGAATTGDALWAGLPVIILQGGHFASRMSSSILTAIGLPELITHGLEDYEALAVRLAQNPGELQTIRQRLAKNRLTKPLFDTPRFARTLEKAYKEMWEIFLAGERPRQIEVREALAKSQNNQALFKVGGNLFRETWLSGDPILGKPDSTVLDNISPISLEQSNVVLTRNLSG